MVDRLSELYGSLVGSNVVFSCSKKVNPSLSIEKNIKLARIKIEKDCHDALLVGGHLGVMLLAELTARYMKEPYYMAVRSAIEMRRYRPAVIDYLKAAPEKRMESIKYLLDGLPKGAKRDLLVRVAEYFIATYPGRLREFKVCLTKEEWLLCS